MSEVKELPWPVGPDPESNPLEVPENSTAPVWKLFRAHKLPQPRVLKDGKTDSYAHRLYCLECKKNGKVKTVTWQVCWFRLLRRLLIAIIAFLQKRSTSNAIKHMKRSHPDEWAKETQPESLLKFLLGCRRWVCFVWLLASSLSQGYVLT